MPSGSTACDDLDRGGGRDWSLRRPRLRNQHERRPGNASTSRRTMSSTVHSFRARGEGVRDDEAGSITGLG